LLRWWTMTPPYWIPCRTSSSRAATRFEASYPLRSFWKAMPFPLMGCLISDIELPGMDGWALETLVLDRLPQMPIIFVTARGEIDELRKKQCVNGVPRIIFKKPFDGGQLLRAVDTAFLATSCGE
jgi:FixJ family two-component response regulator